MNKTFIISLGDLLPDIKEWISEMEGMNRWDEKFIVEVAFSMVATSFDPIHDANKITRRVAERIGLLNILRHDKPEKIFVLIYHVVSRIYFELNSHSLSGMDLYFKQWVGNDIIVDYKESPIKLLPVSEDRK